MEKPRIVNFHKERVYAFEPQEEVSSDMDVCTHFSLGACPCTKKSHAYYSSSTKKRKQQYDDPCSKKTPTTTSRKRARKDVETSWGLSLDLMLYDDPWKIKKVLQESDLGNMSRLLLGKELAENLVLPVLDADAQRDAESARGTDVRVWDVDTSTMHVLVFKRWVSSKSYVFTGKWVQDFVKRRDLKRGDEIGLHWDPYNNHINFSVLRQAI